MGLEIAVCMVSAGFTCQLCRKRRTLGFDICNRVRRTRRAYDTMRAFMHSLVSTTRETIRAEGEDAATKRGRDLFSLLVQASENAEGKMRLNDHELVSRTRGCFVPVTGTNR